MVEKWAPTFVNNKNHVSASCNLCQHPFLFIWSGIFYMPFSPLKKRTSTNLTGMWRHGLQLDNATAKSISLLLVTCLWKIKGNVGPWPPVPMLHILPDRFFRILNVKVAISINKRPTLKDSTDNPGLGYVFFQLTDQGKMSNQVLLGTKLHVAAFVLYFDLVEFNPRLWVEPALIKNVSALVEKLFHIMSTLKLVRKNTIFKRKGVAVVIERLSLNLGWVVRT